MRTAYTISAIGHAAILLWSVWSLAARPLPVSSNEGLPIDLVTASEFSKITAGTKSAPQAETAKPLVEKVAEAKPVEDPTAKVVEKKEVTAAREPPPAPETKPAESEPDKKQAAKPPTPPKKPAPPAPKFDPKQVAALLDKRDSTRLAAAGETLNSKPSLGLSNGAAAQLSLSELDALRARLAQLWTVPAGAKDPQELVVLIRIKLKPDGTLASPPIVLSSGKSPLFIAARDSAVRALFRGQPYDMLKPEHYEQWKDVEITFDPRDMIRG
jgi:colicin import membrane protein